MFRLFKLGLMYTYEIQLIKLSAKIIIWMIWFFSLLQQLSSSQSELYVTITWSLWKRINLKLWQKQNESSRQAVERPTHLLEDWQAAQHIRSQRTTCISMSQGGPNNREVVECTKPAQDRYKYNIDASFSSSSNMVGFEICLRNDSGVFVLAKTNYFSPLCDVDVGEAISLSHIVAMDGCASFC